mgnify:CR=1 FL=1
MSFGDKTMNMQSELLRCPACGAAARLASGDEIVLESLELEVA